MMHPHDADRGDGLQIWKVAANIMNKQQTANKGWSPSLGLDERLTTPHCKKPACYETSHRTLDLYLNDYQLLMDSAPCSKSVIRYNIREKNYFRVPYISQ
jgi:hypothetical protein